MIGVTSNPHGVSHPVRIESALARNPVTGVGSPERKHMRNGPHIDVLWEPPDEGDGDVALWDRLKPSKFKGVDPSA